ncbi:MAG: hypothetical protein JRI36_07820 [Deltaproteobacteria bacterium]|nr:hypothetical protein [Deltaproteobacteria bacterium]
MTCSGKDLSKAEIFYAISDHWQNCGFKPLFGSLLIPAVVLVALMFEKTFERQGRRL